MSDETRVGGISYAELHRYVSGASDEAERQRVEAWVMGNTARQEYLSALTRAWTIAQANRSTADGGEATDAAWTRLEAHLDLRAISDATPRFVTPREVRRLDIVVPHHRAMRSWAGAYQSRRRRILIPAVAAAVLMIGVFGGTLLLRDRDSGRPVTIAPAPMREVVTGAGERQQVQFGDGSTAILGVKSKLRFASDFGMRPRDVYLEGEAYFTVRADSTNPFVVHAADTKTVDLGTEFVIRAYTSENLVRVVVAQGSVALGADVPNAPASVVLRRGELGSLARGALVPTVRLVDPAKYTGWVTGRLEFDNTPLPEVVAELGRWHDVELQLGDTSLARQTFTANLTAASLTETLTTLATVLHLRVERRGKTIVLYRRMP
jgi:ferric-dicitrate binding protein FerR (iron transport regulator)